jgi:hypothetical protein
MYLLRWLFRVSNRKANVFMIVATAPLARLTVDVILVTWGNPRTLPPAMRTLYHKNFWSTHSILYATRFR